MKDELFPKQMYQPITLMFRLSLLSCVF